MGNSAHTTHPLNPDCSPSHQRPDHRTRQLKIKAGALKARHFRLKRPQ
jgi:hypothetical protein